MSSSRSLSHLGLSHNLIPLLILLEHLEALRVYLIRHLDKILEIKAVLELIHADLVPPRLH